MDETGCQYSHHITHTTVIHQWASNNTSPTRAASSWRRASFPTMGFPSGLTISWLGSQDQLVIELSLPWLSLKEVRSGHEGHTLRGGEAERGTCRTFQALVSPPVRTHKWTERVWREGSLGNWTIVCATSQRAKKRNARRRRATQHTHNRLARPPQHAESAV